MVSFKSLRGAYLSNHLSTVEVEDFEVTSKSRFRLQKHARPLPLPSPAVPWAMMVYRVTHTVRKRKQLSLVSEQGGMPWTHSLTRWSVVGSVKRETSEVGTERSRRNS